MLMCMRCRGLCFDERVDRKKEWTSSGDEQSEGVHKREVDTNIEWTSRGVKTNRN